MTEKNKREDLIVLSAGTWDAIITELNDLKAPRLKEFIRSARKRNPAYSEVMSTCSKVEQAINKAIKHHHKRLFTFQSNGGKLYLRLVDFRVSNPLRYVWVPVTLTIKRDGSGLFEVCYDRRKYEVACRALVHPDWIDTSVPENALVFRNLNPAHFPFFEITHERYRKPRLE